MFRKIILALLVMSSMSGVSFAQTGDGEVKNSDVNTDIQTGDQSATDFFLGGVFGAVTIDGKNYQQIGLRPELKIWKFGLGLDISVLLDEDGKVREEDWDEAKDYMDKLYYISFGKKGEPLYFKFGGLDSTTLGYGILLNGYTNMLEYPTYKRQGIDFSFETKYFGGEFIMNDFKEVCEKTPSFMGGGRLYLRPFSRVQIGVSVAGDINEYEGLRDSDGDGYPDEIDAYPDNDEYVTETEYYAAQGLQQSTIDDMVAHGVISGIDRSDITNYEEESSNTGFWAGDIALKLVNNAIVKMTIYSQFSQCMNTKGWGFTVPGMNLQLGNFMTVYAEYKQNSDEYIFGYYNDTYDLERAKFVDDGSGNLYVVTKKDQLEDAIASKGYYAGLRLNFFNIISAKGSYQDLRTEHELDDGEDSIKSLRGELEVNADLIPKISKAKAFYVQNGITEFELKTESTLIGGVVGIDLGGGVSLDFKYLVTFEDKNGDGKIEGEDETIKNISVSTSAVF